ncbi:hypothetical protein ACIBSW_08535 [Actinoplanes sp. NPDC049668]|uniref:hypothetical protein n=1 Tax=unclassified Actinoplanes TaxID=2626549 RepID=UPI0033AF570E
MVIALMWVFAKEDEWSQPVRESVFLAMLLGMFLVMMEVVIAAILAAVRDTRPFGIGMLLGTVIGIFLDIAIWGHLGK